MIELLTLLFSLCAHSCTITPDYTNKEEKVLIIAKNPYNFGTVKLRVIYSCNKICKIIKIEND